VALTTGALVAPFVTAGDDWATLSADGWIAPLGIYSSDVNTGALTDDVKLATGGTTTLLAAATRHSLNLQNRGAGVAKLDLAGWGLTLNSGGLLATGTGPSEIAGGTLLPGSSEWVITNRHALTISAAIGQTSAGTGLTKSGAGVLTLSGVNTFSGNTAITAGTLAVSTDTNLGAGSAVEFSGGMLRALASFASSKGLTNSVSGAAAVDTADHVVSFAGPITGGFSKLGAGTLTLTTATTDNWTVHAGTLALPSVAARSINLRGGELEAAGEVFFLTVDGNAALDIGGPDAATLRTTEFSILEGIKLTINFGVGARVQDLWRDTGRGRFRNMEAMFLFNFHDLGGAAPGTDYVLMETSWPAIRASSFGIAPDASSAGWSGTFSVSNRSVKVRFNSVPEPSAGALLLIGATLLQLRRSGGMQRRD
jgi:autotransporter-associated beta strand protein